MTITDPATQSTQLREQVISRAKLLGRIYYSESPNLIKLLDQTIDEIVKASTSIEMTDPHLMISMLAKFFARSPIARCIIDDQHSRERYFEDMLFEKYNENELIRLVTTCRIV